MPTYWNATTTTSYSSTSIDILPMLIIAGIALASILFIGMYQSLPLYSKIRKFLELIVKSIGYFLHGVLGIAVFAIIGFIIKYFATPGNGKIPIEYIIYAIGSYVGISILGFFVVKFKNRISEYNKLINPTNDENTNEENNDEK